MNRSLGRAIFFAGCLLAAFSSYRLVHSVPKIPPNLEDADISLLYGPQYYDRLLEEIQGAKRKIWVSMYVMSYSPDRDFSVENKLLGELRRRHSKGVDVRVILDASPKWNPDTKALDGEPNPKNQAAFDYLKTQGIPVVYDSMEQQTHSKLVIVDDLIAFVGSHNWTYSALRKNLEISVLIRSAGHNRELSELYEEWWEAGEKQQEWEPSRSAALEERRKNR